MPRYFFEDFAVGDRWEFAPWRVTREDMIAFAEINDPQPLHIDETAAALTPFGGIIASGWQTTLKCITSFVVDVMSQAASLASPGLDEIRWLRPVRAGDVITPRAEVIEVAPSRSKPDRGRVHFLFSGADAGGEAVTTTRGMFFIARRTPG